MVRSAIGTGNLPTLVAAPVSRLTLYSVAVPFAATMVANPAEDVALPLLRVL